MAHPLRWLALVPLNQAELPSFEQLTARYGAQFPAAAPLVQGGSTDRLLTLAAGELTAAVTLVPQPIPWSQLEPLAAAAWHWPDAAESLHGHGAHLLIAVVDDGGRAIDKAECLTRIAAACASLAPATGVVWGPGRLVHAPAAFVEQALQMGPENWPLFLWVDFRIEPVGEGAWRLFTTGLEALGASEIEVERFTGSPQQLLEHAYNFAHYQLVARKAIRDGEQAGLAENVQATVRRTPSPAGGDAEVLRLEFE